MQKSVADKQSEMESKPVLYHRNGNVRFPVTYTQLLRETERLRAEIERLQAELAADKTVAENWQIDAENARLQAHLDRYLAETREE